ncbi:ABC transporter permease [Paraburkholderia sp.]|uniref:ABC transporter permease n=1 Tax=Paraburkholderia sp. TaxID=1926495 RepID=UPI002381FDE4|nr:ABC transporter permease [Paraburkholderia sp.]MDE1180855.1 ABC transporter permease [Paraburkholderia sp.]
MSTQPAAHAPEPPSDVLKRRGKRILQQPLRLLRRLSGVVRRTVPTLAGVIVLNFVLMKLVPGDAADVIAGEAGSATAETMAQLRHHFGLDMTTWQQFERYLVNLAHFDLGTSVRFNAPVMDLILSRVPDTLFLMISALVIALLAGVALGAVMAHWANRWPDRLLSVVALALYSIPGFWIALVAVIVFSVELGWLPSDGSATLGQTLTGWHALADRLRHAALPATTLASFFVAIYARLTRAAMLDVQRQDYVRTAHAKGLSPLGVALRHVLRNALMPITTVAGMHFGNLLGGAVVVETVFSWPGLGRLALDAVQGRDYAVLLGILLFASVMVIVANIAVDLLHAWLDPRIEDRTA